MAVVLGQQLIESFINSMQDFAFQCRRKATEDNFTFPVSGIYNSEPKVNAETRVKKMQRKEHLTR